MRQEEMMEEDTPPWSMEADNLLNAHVDTEQKILDAAVFKMALVTALSDAYEQGLKDGLVTRATGPDD
jgi:hypothetical protein